MPSRSTVALFTQPSISSTLRAKHGLCRRCRWRQYSSQSPSPRPVIFSGIQPTGIPHLGNYLGALRQWVTLQNEATPDTRILYSIVDLHALTITPDPDRLRQQRRETLAVLLAIGLNPERCTIFFQSQVPAHSELMWLLSCRATMGSLSRMTQWKAKMGPVINTTSASEISPFDLRLGLFSYPVLQAADVLVHRATMVPVGEDQVQHLELTRDLASKFGDLFPSPKTLLAPAKRVRSLRDPTVKMSKSQGHEMSRIMLTDTPSIIDSKIRGARTDMDSSVTYDPSQRPGVANLIELLSEFDPQKRSPEDVAREYRNKTLLELKNAVITAVIDGLKGIREEYERIIKNDEGRRYLDHVSQTGATKARESAEETMALVRQSVGI
ncbi:MAG: Tryptophan--tRNA ligase, mitochondrial [Watsoniomyces obsoletus]|nr:MAG: Tryptophan--tRNA ligase, mitochondrial [Watsoniomyces obsoletus]